MTLAISLYLIFPRTHSTGCIKVDIDAGSWNQYPEQNRIWQVEKPEEGLQTHGYLHRHTDHTNKYTREMGEVRELQAIPTENFIRWVSYQRWKPLGCDAHKGKKSQKQLDGIEQWNLVTPVPGWGYLRITAKKHFNPVTHFPGNKEFSFFVFNDTYEQFDANYYMKHHLQRWNKLSVNHALFMDA